MRWVFLLALLLSSLLSAQSVPQPPQRVMSISLCTDQLALELATPGQLASVSWVAHDPHESLIADRVKALHRNQACIEEIIAFNPDLVLASVWNNPYLLQQIDASGIALYRMPDAQTLVQIEQNYRAVFSQLHGAAAVLPALDWPRQTSTDSSDKPRALALQVGGWTASAPSLIDEFISLLGMHNLAEDAGVQGWGQVDLEAVLRLQPDWLFFISSAADEGGLSLKEQYLQHPALRDAPFQSLSLPSGHFGCGTHALVELAEQTRKTIAERTAQLGQP